MENKVASDWALPTGFYFLVDFQNKFEHFQTSFTDVSGLDIQLRAEGKANDTGVWVNMPHELKYGNITLKRPVGVASNDPFTKWIDGNLNRDNGPYIKIQNMVVKLLGSDKGKPLAGWHCACVYPIQWSLSALNADKSELAMETIVLTCNRIGRITV